MDEVEAGALAEVYAELGSAVVAVGDPVADVLDRGERVAGDGAHERERPATDAFAGDDGEAGPEHAGRPPRRHLPRRPRPLSEEEVRGQPGERADDESGGAPERVARYQHDVGRRLDVRERGERDSPERGERRERAHERDDSGIRARPLVPGEPRGEREPEDRE